jgi:hypothetical protein
MHVDAIYFLQQIPGHFIFKTRLPKGHVVTMMYCL